MLVCYICTVPAHIIRSKAKKEAGTTERRWPWKGSGRGETKKAPGSESFQVVGSWRGG